MGSTLPAFDVLVDMARNDPQGLELLRKRLTGAVIDDASNDILRRRLKGLQFKVEMECKKSTSPMGACIRISEMMCRSLAHLQRSIVDPESCQRELEGQTPNVLDFSRPGS